AGGQVAAERLPGLAEVLGDVDVGLVVVRAVGIEGNVAAALNVARRLDGGDPARAGQTHLVGDVGPVLATIARYPHIAVVGADPQYLRVARWLGQGGAAATLGARDLWRDGPQAVTLLVRAEHKVAGTVEDARVVARQNERRIPVEAVRRLAAARSARLGLIALRRSGGAREDHGPLTGAGGARRARGAVGGGEVAREDNPVLAPEVAHAGAEGTARADEAAPAADEDPVLVDRPGALEAVARPAP